MKVKIEITEKEQDNLHFCIGALEEVHKQTGYAVVDVAITYLKGINEKIKEAREQQK